MNVRSCRWVWSVVNAVGLVFGEMSAVGADLDRAEPKAGREVDPPLSADVPEAVSALPLFGSIAWETHRLPWVDAGPDGGISGVGMVEYQGELYVFGGFIPTGDETQDATSRRTSRGAWRYDPQEDRWERLPDMPVRREYTRAIAADTGILVVGGASQYKGEDPPYRPHDDSMALELSATQPVWHETGNLHVPRTHMAVGRSGDHLVVAGGNEYDFAEQGYSHNTIRATTEVFDLNAPEKGWQLREPIPGAGRGWSAAVTANDHLYVFGGLTWLPSGETQPTRETLRYDPRADSWEHLTPPPLPVSGWEGALYDNRYALLVGGVVRGDAADTWSDLVVAYDVTSDRWLQIEGALPPGAVFNDSGVAIVGDTIYVLGGEGPHSSHYNYILKGTITPEAAPIGESYTAVSGATVWPNLTRLPNGDMLLAGFDKPSHGQVEGDVACWVSADEGATWTFRSTITSHEPETVRMNHAVGLDQHGNVIALVGGWTDVQQPGAPKRNVFRDAILGPWVRLSTDAGKTWTDHGAFPTDLHGRPFVVFGDVIPSKGGRLNVSAYSTSYWEHPEPWAAYFIVSVDNGTTWQIRSKIDDDCSETALLDLGGGAWLAAIRGKATTLYRSTDDGVTWTEEAQITKNRQYPAHLLRLNDGRILLTYGDRTPGHLGAGARISADEGKTWGEPTYLAAMPQSDGGYPASIQRNDGRILTLFYAKGDNDYSVQAVVWDAPAP